MTAVRPKWVVFDAVGTLLTPEPAVGQAYWQVGSRHGSRLSLAEVEDLFRQAFRDSEVACFPESRRGLTSEREEFDRWRWIVGQVFPDVCDGEACFQSLWDHFAAPAAWRTYEDVGPAVEGLLSRGLRIAIASNFDARLHRLCAADPHLRRFTPVLVSSEVGYRKPAPEFYAAILTACRAEGPEVMFVGDDWESDVVAPCRQGMRSLWLNRRAAGDSADGIASLASLWSRLDGLG